MDMEFVESEIVADPNDLTFALDGTSSNAATLKREATLAKVQSALVSTQGSFKPSSTGGGPLKSHKSQARAEAFKMGGSFVGTNASALGGTGASAFGQMTATVGTKTTFSGISDTNSQGGASSTGTGISGTGMSGTGFSGTGMS